MRLATMILAASLATSATAGELWVINAAGKYDGRRYNSDEQRFRDHHQQYAERCVWLDTAPEQTGTDADGRAIYRAPTAAELAMEAYPLPESVVPLIGTNGVQVGTARIVVDATTMQPIAVVNSASPQKSWAEQRAEYQASASSRASIVTELKGLKTSMTNAIAVAQAIDPTAWTGAQRTQMQAVRRGLIDQAQNSNALRRMLLKYFRVNE